MDGQNNKELSAELLIISTDQSCGSNLLDALHKFQYGETKEESDSGFKELEKLAESQEES